MQAVLIERNFLVNDWPELSDLRTTHNTALCRLVGGPWTIIWAGCRRE